MQQAIIRGNTFFYEDLNTQEREGILFVHGHPFNHTMWKYQHDALHNFRLILPDLRGYGQSDHQFDKIYIEEQALDLALLLDQLEIEKVHLVGLSMGGQIIVEFHRLFPQKVISLAICASTPSAETPESYAHRLQLASTIKEVGMLAYTQQAIHEYINLEKVGTNSAVYQHLFDMMSNITAVGAAASHRGRAERRDNFAYLQQIKVPTLVIAGEKDYFFKVADVEQVAQQIVGARFHLIHHAGHLPNMEQPDIFNEVLLNFYQALPS